MEIIKQNEILKRVLFTSFWTKAMFHPAIQTKPLSGQANDEATII